MNTYSVERRIKSEEELEKQIFFVEKAVQSIMNELSSTTISYNQKLHKAFNLIEKQILSQIINQEPSRRLKCLEVHSLMETLERNVDFFLNGQYARCYNSIRQWWFTRGYEASHGRFYTLKPSMPLYRMRKSVANETFSHKDMFHVPFEERGRIRNYRYSLSGYPCLYCGTSILLCWEEIQCKNLIDFCVSRLKIADKLNLLDMRLYQKDTIGSLKDLYRYVAMLPLIIACSIKVKEDDDFFKPEYILPQLILSTVCNSGSFTPRYKGIIYTSSRFDQTLIEKDPNLYNNIVIPVHQSKEKGLCDWLCDMFLITEPVDYKEVVEHEGIEYLHDAETSFPNTYFNLLESYLHEKKTYSLKKN